MFKTIIHIEDQPQATQAEVYRYIGKAADDRGIQLTPRDFCVDPNGVLSIDGMEPTDWLDSI